MKVKFSFEAKKEFRKNLTFIQNNPKLAELKYYDIRVLAVKTFPFTIHYKIEKEYIVIVAIFHTSQNPDKLK